MYKSNNDESLFIKLIFFFNSVAVIITVYSCRLSTVIFLLIIYYDMLNFLLDVFLAVRTHIMERNYQCTNTYRVVSGL
jgi:hypothetical protein